MLGTLGRKTRTPGRKWCCCCGAGQTFFDEFSSFAFIMSGLRRITSSFTCKEEVQLNFGYGEICRVADPLYKDKLSSSKTRYSRPVQQYQCIFPLARVLTWVGTTYMPIHTIGKSYVRIPLDEFCDHVCSRRIHRRTIFRRIHNSPSRRI